MSRIPRALPAHSNAAFPANLCLVDTVRPDPDRTGFAVPIRVQRAEDLGGYPLHLD